MFSWQITKYFYNYLPLEYSCYPRYIFSMKYVKNNLGLLSFVLNKLQSISFTSSTGIQLIYHHLIVNNLDTSIVPHDAYRQLIVLAQQ